MEDYELGAAAAPADTRTNGFAIRGDIARTIRKMGVGLPGDGRVWVRPWTIWHRQNVNKVSQISFRFFNEGSISGATNLEQPNQLPAQYGFVVRAIALDFLPGFDRAGNRLGIVAPVTAERAASVLNYGAAAATITDNVSAVWKWHEKIREFLSQGTVSFKVTEQPVLSEYGLLSFPSGRGIVSSGSSDTAMTAAAASNSVQHVYTTIANGAPVAGNHRLVRGGFPLLAGQQFNVDVVFEKAVDFTEADIGPLNGVANSVTAGVLECKLIGEMVSPKNI